MKRFLLAAAAASLLASPAAAALKVGAKAPVFTTPGYLAGEPVTVALADAMKKGPVVLYFFPAAHTAGCSIEARLFSEAADQFKAQKATVIGITAGNLKTLAAFSKETEHCAGKFAVAADPGAKIAKEYDSVLAMKPDWSDRTSYVISPKGEILLAYTKGDPTNHVSETMAAVKAYNAKK